MARRRARAHADGDGSVLATAETVVIMIGLNRTLAALMIAAIGSRFSDRSAAIAKSIIMIAFFFTMPISMMIPTYLYTPSSTFVR